MSKARLKELAVTRLFDKFNYRIPLASPIGSDTGLVIITAPNGYGKSTLLRLLNDIARGNDYGLASTQFRELSLVTTDGTELKINREISK